MQLNKEWINEYLTTPQHKNKIGYLVSTMNEGNMKTKTFKSI